MKKFLNKLKNLLSFKKGSSSSIDEDEYIESFDELNDLEEGVFEEDSPTDPNINLPKHEITQERTQPELIRPENTEPELNLDFPPAIEETPDIPNETFDISIPEVKTNDKENPETPIIPETPKPSSESLNFDSLPSDSSHNNEDTDFDITDPNFVQMPQPTLLTKVKSFIDKTTTSLFKKKQQDEFNELDEDLPLSDQDSTDKSINLDMDIDEAPSKPFKEKLYTFLPFLRRKNTTDSLNTDDQQQFTNDFSDDFTEKEKSKVSLSQFSGLGFFHWLFSVETRPTLHKSFLVLLWLFLVFNIGKFSGLFLSGTKVKKVTSRSVGAPIEAISLPRRLFNKLASQDIFSASMLQEQKKVVEVEKTDQDELCLKSDTPSKFKSFYYLFNTIVLKNSKKSIASFQLRSDPKLLEIREGGQIDSRFRVDRIGRLKVIGKNLNSNECEFFENEKAKEAPKRIKTLSKSDSRLAKTKLKKIQGIQNDGNKVKIKRTFLNEQLSNISGLLKQALAIPINNPDGSVAFRITDIEPGSIYSYLNIQNGDTITEINGNKIATQNEVLNLFSKLKTVKKLQLTVNRGGAPQQLDYTFE